MGLAYENTGHFAEALFRFESSLAIRREVGDRRGEATTRWNVGRLVESQGDLERAAREMRAAVAEPLTPYRADAD